MEKVLVNKYECGRCGHKWISRIDKIPRYCPKCKSPYWNKQKSRK